MIRKLTTVAVLLALASCGESEADRLAREAQAASQAAEQQRFAAERACVKASSEVFNASLGGSVSTTYSTLKGVNLSGCPADFASSYGAFVSRVAALDQANQALSSITGSAESACQAGAVLTVFEIISGASTGATPCADNFAATSSLRDEVTRAQSNLRSADADLRASFAQHGFIEEQMVNGNNQTDAAAAAEAPAADAMGASEFDSATMKK